MDTNIIKNTDNEIAELILEELHRQENTIELIASENIASKAVMAAAGTVLTNKYAEGKPYKRFYNSYISKTFLYIRIKIIYLLLHNLKSWSSITYYHSNCNSKNRCDHRYNCRQSYIKP